MKNKSKADNNQYRECVNSGIFVKHNHEEHMDDSSLDQNFSQSFENFERNTQISVSSENFSIENVVSDNGSEHINFPQTCERVPQVLKPLLTNWTLNNLDTLRLNVVSELLVVLRKVGHNDLPKTAQALLGTKHRRVLQTMTTKKQTTGQYIYLGIEHGLKNVICPDIYNENKIAITVHIDGMSVYQNSQVQVWPIIAKLWDEGYISKPFVIALYCGDSKPHSVCEYLSDFVNEANHLILNGITIHGRHFSFAIFALIADSPARAFLKCCKPPGAFHACERCTTRGISVREKRNIKRVYPEINCPMRTKTSFFEKEDIDHHQKNIQSPLTLITDFDPVKSVVLDSMHLLYLGVMKTLMEKWILRGSAARIKLSQVKTLKMTMNLISSDVPIEFQRKKFDVNIVSKWKATQFRFMLLYCGPLVLKNILPRELYRHFLLLFVGCRILHDGDMIKYSDYARSLLRNFFNSLATLYGEESQVLSMHNLIHLADDVSNFQAPLSTISAFWGESYIGVFKKLVKSPKKPLTQIVNRLSERETGDHMKLCKKQTLYKCDFHKIPTIIEHDTETYINVIKVYANAMALQTHHPENIVRLNNGKIIIIKKILIKKSKKIGVI